MPSLPPELQREIFEIALRSSSGDAALKLKLSLLAHHIHDWVDSAFYELVIIRKDASAEKFLKLVDSKPPGFFAMVVKTLVMFRATSQAARILSVCAEVQWLCVWGCRVSVLDLSPVSNYPLRRLSMLPTLLPTLDFSECLTTMLVTAPTPPSCLRTLTHLDYNPSEVTPSDVKDLLRRFPRLTHIALYGLLSSLHIEAVRATCVNLQVLIVPRLGGYPGPAFAEECSDMRIVMIAPPEAFTDWTAGHFGLPDMWTRAEDIVAERKRSATTWNSGRAI
ncbi:hypothetical protein DFH08DRAFT_366426 [Mycena albidolilacea]|uniref:Uncharacterized protein n=1 Tax=Mycena albidolilacea TaxID=1033008 RepID=A0AAD7AK55_9AGAR|nr:hypothetical protein DFH08DRAFT_366426 [Mycena albidolilacea]